MKFKSTILGQTSGALDGTVFSHNRGGRYTRVRAIPTNPNSPQQQAIRGFVAQLTALWLDTLTALQRAAWDLYALNVPLIDRLGEARNVGGIAMYVRSNVPRLQVALPRVDDAPTIFNLGSYSIPGVSTITEAAQTASFAFSITDEWPAEDDAAMLIYWSRAQNPSINYFKGPYRSVDPLLGDTAIPLTSPQIVAAAFAFVSGQKVFFRVNVTRADGRLGAESFIEGLTGA